MYLNVKLVPLKGEKDSILWQWDTDRRIMIEKKEDVVIDEIHFSNSYGESLATELDENNELSAMVLGRYVVVIPDKLLQSYMPINVYVVMHTLHGKRTVYHTSFRVASRPKPSNYVL